MTEENLPVPVATEELVEVPAKADPETSIRVRMGRTRDRLIESAARRMIRLGQASPRLRDAGLWLYGTATMLAPRGREVPMLGEVGEQILRGGQPSFRAFKTLQELGVNTVINLRPESDHERKMVEQLGMRYRYMPLPPLGAPSHEMTLDFLHAVTDPAAGKVFFHCYHGVDRTGTMAACLRIARRPPVAVIFEPAFEIVLRSMRRKRRKLAQSIPHCDQRPLLRDEHVRSRHPGRRNEAKKDKARAKEPDARFPEHQPQPAGKHQREGDGRNFRQVSDRARKRADHSCAPGHPFDAPTHWLQRNPFEAERHQNHGAQRHGHDDDVANGNGDHIRQHRVLLALMEVVGGEGRDGDAGDQCRRYDLAKELRDARERVGPRAGSKNSDQPFMRCDQRRHRRERHLKPGVEQAFRIDRQNEKCRKRNVSERQRRPVDQHCAEDDQDHQRRTDGRKGSTRNREIAERAQDSDRRGDLLDRQPQREKRNGSKQQTHRIEHGPCHDDHVQARNRKNVE